MLLRCCRPSQLLWLGQCCRHVAAILLSGHNYSMLQVEEFVGVPRGGDGTSLNTIPSMLSWVHAQVDSVA